MQRLVTHVKLIRFRDEVNSYLEDGWEIVPESIRLVVDSQASPGIGAFSAVVQKASSEHRRELQGLATEDVEMEP